MQNHPLHRGAKCRRSVAQPPPQRPRAFCQVDGDEGVGRFPRKRRVVGIVGDGVAVDADIDRRQQRGLKL